jgi:hypothetical protein
VNAAGAQRGINMNTRIPVLGLATLLALFATGAQADGEYYKGLPSGTVLEASVETTAGNVIFPAGSEGRLQVRDCVGCARATIQIDGKTIFNLAGSQVSLRDMADFATRNPTTALTIHYRLRDSIASRVSVLSK